MKLLSFGISVLLSLGSSACLAQNPGGCATPFEAPLKSGTTLTIDTQSAEVRVVGVERDMVRVSCTVDHEGREDSAREIEVRMTATGEFHKLRVKGGPTSNVHITIEVPRSTNLRINTPAGNVSVKQVDGDKDIELHAGEITVAHVNSEEYRLVEASVNVGQVSSSAFKVDKGGFFPHFRRESATGKYRLRAHVGTGHIGLD